LDAANIRIQPEMVKLSDIVRDVVQSMQREINGRPVEISADEPFRASAMDRRLIRLAVKQLLDNALKYSYPRTPLLIRVFEGEGTVSLEISNRGPAIPVEELSRIFDRFYRSPAVDRQIPGSGLGLTISQSIVRAHNGELTVASRPGETTFRLILPVRLQEAEHEREPRSRN